MARGMVPRRAFRSDAMKNLSKLALSLSILGLTNVSGAVFAEGMGQQTMPGAAHGPTTVDPNGANRTGSDAGAAAGMNAHGGVSNDNSAAGMGTQQGSGGMQPRLQKGGPSGSSANPSTAPGNAQGL
jgi:hypothetical protein